MTILLHFLSFFLWDFLSPSHILVHADWCRKQLQKKTTYDACITGNFKPNIKGKKKTMRSGAMQWICFIVGVDFSHQTILGDRNQTHQRDCNGRSSKQSTQYPLQNHISYRLPLNIHYKLGHTDNFSAIVVRFLVCRTSAQIMQL